MISENQTAPQTHACDENFLQDWLENRFGFGFAQMVLDDLGDRDVLIKAPYEASSYSSSNDNKKVTFKHSA